MPIKNRRRNPKKKKRGIQDKKAANILSGAPPPEEDDAAAASAASLSVEELVERADAAMIASECGAALRSYGAALALLSSSSGEERPLLRARLLARSGEARLALGDAERGRDDFAAAVDAVRRSTDDDAVHDVRADLHLTLGQLHTGEEALGHYRTGVAALEQHLHRLAGAAATSASATTPPPTDDDMEDTTTADTNNEDADPALALTEARKRLCSAYCSVGELYLTDLCFAPDAEAQCEAALKSALDHDRQCPSNGPDALQALANLRLSQSRGAEAAESMMEAYGRMHKGCAAMARLVGLADTTTTTAATEEEEGAVELEHVEEATSLPGIEFRSQSAKLLLECGAVLAEEEEMEEEDDDDDGEEDRTRTCTSEQCLEAAVHVLGSLMAENDEVVETWFLLGCAFESLSSENNDNGTLARHYWERALEMLGDVKKVTEEKIMECDDDEAVELKAELEDTTERMKDVQERLNNLGDPAPTDDMDEQ